MLRKRRGEGRERGDFGGPRIGVEVGGFGKGVDLVVDQDAERGIDF